ncbi:MAG: alpha/beta hydrolase, partial [Proteobacteria bacterium]|nr:alpha/beta hydrolase [Pseudomonadota bacterium]
MSLSFIRFIYSTLGPVFPAYFGNRAYQQWFTTFRFNTPAYELDALNSATEEDIDVNGLKVKIYIWQSEETGSSDTDPAATVLFIHGWTGRGTQIAKYIGPLNALGYRVLSFDGPAHGKTPGRQTSLLEFTDVVFALDEHYGPFDAAITHSFGGMVLAFAMAKGLTLKRAACICPPKSFQVLTDNFQRILKLPESVMRVLVRKTYESHGQITRDAVDTLKNVKDLACKGLLIHDEDDDEISWHSSEEIARAWP